MVLMILTKVVSFFQVDMKKVALDVIKDWMIKRIRELLGIDDEVVIEYALGMLQEEVKVLRNP